MSRRCVVIFAGILLCAGSVVAYGAGNGQGGPPSTPPGQGQGPGQQPGDATPNPAKVILNLFDGTIVDVMAEYGAEYPAILFEQASLENQIPVRLAPLPFLEDALSLSLEMLQTFEGQPADLVAMSKTTGDEVVYHAITLTVGGVTYRFRTDEGKPLWNGSGKTKDRKGTEPTLQAGTTRDLGGEVLRVVPSLITGDLKLMLLGDDGRRYGIRLAPAEDLLATDFALRDRNRVRVRFALETGTGRAVALQLSTEAQMTLRLRNENGQRLMLNLE